MIDQSILDVHRPVFSHPKMTREQINWAASHDWFKAADYIEGFVVVEEVSTWPVNKLDPAVEYIATKTGERSLTIREDGVIVTVVQMAFYDYRTLRDFAGY